MIPVRKNKVATNLKVHILQWVCPYHCMLLFHCVSNTKYTQYPTQFDRITCTISFYVTYFLWSLVTASVFCALWSHNSLQASAKAWDQRQTWKKIVLFVGFWGRNYISASEVILRQTASTATWAHKSEKRGFGLPDRCVLYNAWKYVLPWERFWPLLFNKRRDGRCSQTKKKLQCYVCCLELPHFWKFTPRNASLRYLQWKFF